MRAFIRGFLGLHWPSTPFTRSRHIYFIVVYLFRSTDDVSLSLIPLVHVVYQEETGDGVGHRLSVSSPLPWGMEDAYGVCGASMCPWDMGGGDGSHWGPPVLSSMTSERIQRSEKGGEAGSDPRGHLWVTWGVYLCAGKPPLADIILFHPPGLTRSDSAIGLAIPAMSGHIQYRGAASGDLHIRVSGINRVLFIIMFP